MLRPNRLRKYSGSVTTSAARMRLAKNAPISTRQTAKPMGRAAPAQKPNAADRSALPMVALESTGWAIRTAVTSTAGSARPATR